MQTLLAIIVVFILISIYKSIPPEVWPPVVIVAGIIVLFLAAWFSLAFLVRWFLKIALKIKG